MAATSGGRKPYGPMTGLSRQKAVDETREGVSCLETRKDSGFPKQYYCSRLHLDTITSKN